MLSKNHRIISRIAFQKILEKGERKENQYFKIFFLKNDKDISRFAVIISSKICPSAVKRNLIKRRIKHILRDLIASLPSGFDVLIFAKKDCLEISFPALKKQLEEFLISNVK